MIYLDESGHTGTQKYEDDKWNINGQPYFVLAALIINEQKIQDLSDGIDKIMKKNKIQRELKSTHKSVRKNIKSIADDLKKILDTTKSSIVCEVVNKRYCIAMQIVNYCVLPYYDSDISDTDAIVVRQVFANYIYENIDDIILGKFVEMFDSNRQDIDELLSLCSILINKLEMKLVRDYIEETMDTIRNYQAMGLKLSNLFPLADRYKGGISTVSVCPHIDSLNHIILTFPSESKIIHDEISDIDLALIENVKAHMYLYKRKIHISFEKSVENKCLQFIDMFAGNVRMYFEKLICNEDISDIPDIFKEIVSLNTNVVAPFSEQCKIFPSNKELTAMKFYYEDLKNHTD